ncbi:hypothetical protein KGQ71_04500, partial [Patescibacteria group bacterium]|nr:hypothetical protein [Patescibacteria group bacterium]
NLSSREDSALGLWLEVGIDLKPANILQKDPTSVPQYADLVPARMRKQNGDPEVELPAPLTRQGFDLAYWRAFNLNGLVTMTLSQLCRIRPELSHQFINTGYDFARQLGNAELLRYLDQFEGIRFLTANPRDRLTIIEQLPNHAMYAMRMIGCVVVAEQTSGTFPSDLLPVLLEEVHHLTHFGDDPASDADTAQAKHILTSLSQGRIPYLDDIIRS